LAGASHRVDHNSSPGALLEGQLRFQIQLIAFTVWRGSCYRMTKFVAQEPQTDAEKYVTNPHLKNSCRAEQALRQKLFGDWMVDRHRGKVF